MIYVMSDFHLPSSIGKTMEKFGWGNHMEKIAQQWPLTEEDTIIMPGDLSWALKAGELKPDLDWLSSLPGKKVLLKGNHDLWWNSSKKVKEIFDAYNDFSFVYNNSILVEEASICGTRGWDITSFTEDDEKIREREVIRLKISLDAAEGNNIIVFMHYPPILKDSGYDKFHNLLLSYGIKHVYYGHLHADAIKNAFIGERDGINYHLVSADYLEFKPIAVE